MKFSFGLFLALAVPASALRAGSKVGQKLLSSARRLDQNNQDQDATWVANYSIKFDSCHTLVQVAEEEGENGSLIYNRNLVKFYLCPTDTCDSHVKNCGQYVVGMEEFVDAWTEAKLEEKEYACEMIRENCYCDNANDDEVCENQCYTTAGMEECIEYEGQDAFEIQEYIECREVENQNDNGNNNNGNQYYEVNGQQYYYEGLFAGPYCASSGKKIHFGMFYDEFCQYRADDTMYATMDYYGRDLPFSIDSGDSVVDGTCMSCMEVDEDNNNNNNNNNGNNNNQNAEAIQLCQEMYEMSGKCEENIETSNSYQYKDSRGCDYINSILPKLSASSKAVSSGSSGSGGTASVVLAWLFGFTTLALGVYAFLLFRKLRRSKVNLSDQSGSGDMS